MNCDELKSSILNWFGSEIECQPKGENSVIASFPVLRLNGDAIEIGISPVEGGGWVLSDLGETHSMFFLADLDFHQDYVRAEEFKQMMVAHQLTGVDQEIILRASENELPDRIFEFLHALQSMSGLQFTAKPRKEARDFNTVVALFFAEQRADITIPTEPMEGLGGSWKFDFSLNHSPEPTFIKTISTIGKNQIVPLSERALFEIGDVSKVRSFDGIVIGDDHGRERSALWTAPVLRLFEEYKVPFYAFEKNQDDLVQLAQRHQITET